MNQNGGVIENEEYSLGSERRSPLPSVGGWSIRAYYVCHLPATARLGSQSGPRLEQLPFTEGDIDANLNSTRANLQE